MNKLWTVLATAGFLLAGPALAAGVAFEDADTNGDGAVSMDEAKAVMPDLTAEQFAAADGNADGVLSSDEFGGLGS